MSGKLIIKGRSAGPVGRPRKADGTTTSPARKTPDANDRASLDGLAPERALLHPRSTAASRQGGTPLPPGVPPSLQAQLEATAQSQATITRNAAPDSTKLAQEYGLADSPLLQPMATVEARSKSTLGTGSFNTVYKVEVDGKSMVFKPCRKPQQRQLPRAGLRTGISRDDYYPELRHLALVGIARALGLAGDQGVVGEARMAIVDGVPGLLMDLAGGEADGKWEVTRRVTASDPSWGKLCQEPLFGLLKTEDHNRQLRCITGLHTIRPEKDGVVIITGTFSSSQSQERLRSPSYRRAMADAQLVAWLANAADLHPGNLLVHQHEGEYSVKIIDGDECMGDVDWHSAQKDHQPESIYPMAPPPLFLSQQTASRIASPEFRQALASLAEQLQGNAGKGLSKRQVDALDQRLQYVQDGLAAGHIKVITDDAGWREADFSDPRHSLVARDQTATWRDSVAG